MAIITVNRHASENNLRLAPKQLHKESKKEAGTVQKRSYVKFKCMNWIEHEAR